MTTYSQLRLISVLLKLTALLLFIFALLLPMIEYLQPGGMVPTLRLVGSTITNGLMYLLFSYGGAKAIDLLLSIEGDVHDVAQVVRASRRRRESTREDLAPTAPDPDRHIWSDHPGSIRDGRNLQQPTYNVFGERVHRGKPKGIRRTD